MFSNLFPIVYCSLLTSSSIIMCIRFLCNGYRALNNLSTQSMCVDPLDFIYIYDRLLGGDSHAGHAVMTHQHCTAHGSSVSQPTRR